MSNEISNEDIQQDIIDNIAILIFRTLRSQKLEEFVPRYDADKSDDLIKSAKEKAIKLRQIRNDLEDIFAASY